MLPCVCTVICLAIMTIVTKTEHSIQLANLFKFKYFITNGVPCLPSKKVVLQLLVTFISLLQLNYVLCRLYC